MTYTFRHLPELIQCSAINAGDRRNSKKMCMDHSSVHKWIWYSNVDKYHIEKIQQTFTPIEKKFYWIINHGTS